MNEPDKIISSWGGHILQLRTFEILGDTLMTGRVASTIIVIDTGKTLHNNATYLELDYDAAHSSYTNDGTIDGTGLFRIRQYTGGTTTIDLDQGTITCDDGLSIFTNVVASADQTIQLAGDTTLDCDLSVIGYAPETITLHHLSLIHI